MYIDGYVMPEKLSPEQLKANEEALWSYLRTIATPKRAAIPYLDEATLPYQVLKGLIERVKKFIQFLSKLNPLEYISWMENAFSSISSQNKVKAQALTKVHQSNESLGTNDTTQNVKPGFGFSRFRKKRASKNKRNGR